MAGLLERTNGASLEEIYLDLTRATGAASSHHDMEELT
jgi:hypothetical protein